MFGLKKKKKGQKQIQIYLGGQEKGEYKYNYSDWYWQI